MDVQQVFATKSFNYCTRISDTTLTSRQPTQEAKVNNNCKETISINKITVNILANNLLLSPPPHSFNGSLFFSDLERVELISSPFLSVYPAEERIF